MIKKAIQIGDPRVRAKSKNVKIEDIDSAETQNLVKDLTQSMRHYGLVGMAAPQLGVNLNVFVSEIRKTKFRNKITPDKLRVFINPQISKLSKKKLDMTEGCGTVDYGNLHGPVRRSISLTAEAYDQRGQKFIFIAKGLIAQIIQHEHDHLLGILCIDKFTDTRKIFHKELRKK